MRLSYITIAIALICILNVPEVLSQITPTPSTAIIGNSQTFTYSTGTVVFNPQWRLSLMIGTITSQTQTGTTYKATITWNSTGNETVALFDGSTLKAQLAVNV